ELALAALGNRGLHRSTAVSAVLSVLLLRTAVATGLKVVVAGLCRAVLGGFISGVLLAGAVRCGRAGVFAVSSPVSGKHVRLAHCCRPLLDVCLDSIVG